MVAEINKVATVELDLHRHLFGSDRIIPPKALRDGIVALQDGQCFYCGGTLGAAPEADHFIPRIRCGIDAIGAAGVPATAANRSHLKARLAPQRGQPRPTFPQPVTAMFTGIPPASGNPPSGKRGIFAGSRESRGLFLFKWLGARHRPATSLPGCRGGFRRYRAMTATVVRPPSTSSTMPWTKADSSLAR